MIRRKLPTIGIIALLVGPLCFIGRPTSSRGDEGAAAPTTRPDLAVHQETLPDGGLLHVVTPATQPGETAGPATKPATKPAKPAVAVAPEAQPELDAVRDAYKALASLRVAGTITGEFDLNGQQSTRHGSFEADYRGSTDAAPRFRQTNHDDDARHAERESSIVGSTGEKLYFYDPAMKETQTADAPGGKFAAGKMPRPYYDLLSQQDPSLLLAVVDDAAAEILDGLDSVKKADDLKIGEESCPVLRLMDKDGNPTDLAFDSKTHLLRRSISDLSKVYEKQGQSDVKKVLITIDYTQTSTDSESKPESFAFKAPEGTREIPVMASAGPQLTAPGGGAPADSLVGKAAPDFKLKGMDDQDVALSDLKGNVVVLDFWATWCGPCRASLPHLNKLYESKKNDGLKVFALDLKEDKDDVQKGITELKLTIPVLLDSDGKVAEKYLVNGIPQTVVIGKDGKVKKVIVGFGGSDAELRKAVDEAMK